MENPLFGPAGSSASFAAEGHTSTLEAPAWLAARGLTAYEYQCGHGLRVKLDTAAGFGAEAKAHGIAVSLHAPYYISLASDDPAKRDNSVRYILESARLVSAMGGTRIVVHPGGLGGLARRDAAALAARTLRRAQEALDGEGLSHVHICPETMGKIQQLGDLAGRGTGPLLSRPFFPDRVQQRRGKTPSDLCGAPWIRPRTRAADGAGRRTGPHAGRHLRVGRNPG